MSGVRWTAGGEFQPLTYASRVADTSVLAQESRSTMIIERSAASLHDQTPSASACTRSWTNDFPAGAAGEIVGVAEAHHAAPDLDLVRSRGRIVADLG